MKLLRLDAAAVAKDAWINIFTFKGAKEITFVTM
jgi:hypothetical protein